MGLYDVQEGEEKVDKKEEIANVQDTTLPEKDSKDDHPTLRKRK